MVFVHDVVYLNLLLSVGIWLKARTLKPLGLYHGVFVLQVWTCNPVERVELLGLPRGRRSVCCCQEIGSPGIVCCIRIIWGTRGRAHVKIVGCVTWRNGFASWSGRMFKRRRIGTHAALPRVSLVRLAAGSDAPSAGLQVAARNADRASAAPVLQLQRDCGPLVVPRNDAPLVKPYTRGSMDKGVRSGSHRGKP